MNGFENENNNDFLGQETQGSQHDELSSYHPEKRGRFDVDSSDSDDEHVRKNKGDQQPALVFLAYNANLSSTLKLCTDAKLNSIRNNFANRFKNIDGKVFRRMKKREKLLQVLSTRGEEDFVKRAMLVLQNRAFASVNLETFGDSSLFSSLVDINGITFRSRIDTFVESFFVNALQLVIDFTEAEMLHFNNSLDELSLALTQATAELQTEDPQLFGGSKEAVKDFYDSITAKRSDYMEKLTNDYEAKVNKAKAEASADTTTTVSSDMVLVDALFSQQSPTVQQNSSDAEQEENMSVSSSSNDATPAVPPNPDPLQQEPANPTPANSTPAMPFNAEHITPLIADIVRDTVAVAVRGAVDVAVNDAVQRAFQQHLQTAPGKGLGKGPRVARGDQQPRAPKEQQMLRAAPDTSFQAREANPPGNSGGRPVQQSAGSRPQTPAPNNAAPQQPTKQQKHKNNKKKPLQHPQQGSKQSAGDA